MRIQLLERSFCHLKVSLETVDGSLSKVRRHLLHLGVGHVLVALQERLFDLCREEYTLMIWILSHAIERVGARS